MTNVAPPPPLTAEQLARIQRAVAVVMGKGYGQVSVVIVKGKLHHIKIEISESLD